MMRLKTIFCLLYICSGSSATTYYISTSHGNDLTGHGTSENSAWRTISRAGRNRFLPGDTILFKSGDTWREPLIIRSSGAAGKFITYGSYGKGDKPRILGSIRVTNWKVYRGNIWISTESFKDPYAGGTSGSEIFFVEKDGTVNWGHKKKSGVVACSSEYDWTWSSGHIYIYAKANPASQYSSVEIPQKSWGLDLNDKEYIIIDGLTIQFCQNGGIGGGSYPTPDKSFLIIKNSSVSYCGIKNGDNFGISAVYSNMLIQNNVIHDIGRRGISIYGYGKGGFSTHDIVIEGNTLFNGFHTTGVDISCGYGSFTQYFDGIIIRNNIIFDNPRANVTPPEGGSPELINIESYYNPAVRIRNLWIYNNLLKYPANNAIHIYGIDGAYIFNNTFYGHNELKENNTFHISVTNGCRNVEIKNNIFYTPLVFDTNSRGVAIQVTSSQDYKNINADYNFYYRINPKFRIIETGGTVFHSDEFSSIRKILGWEIHGKNVNPLFVSDSDYHLNPGSPAIGKGIKVDRITNDFDGRKYRNPPSIGAYESNPGK
jgi:hypothetical protein